MENKKTNSLSLTKGKIAALLCLIVIVLAFIFACLKSVLPLGAGIVGTFGVMVYPVLVILAFLALAKFLGFSYRRSIKATVFMTTFILCILFVIHCIRTFSALDAVANGKTFAAYLGLSYEKLTVLGSFGSILCAILSIMLGGFGTIVVFVILATLMIGLFIDFELYGKYEAKHIKKLRSRKLREKVVSSESGAENGKPNYTFASEEKNYTDEDVLDETSVEIDENFDNNQPNYTENDTAYQTEENVNQYAENYTQNQGDSYQNINFFGGEAYTNGYNQNSFENDGNSNYSETPAFTNDVYAEENYPNVFNDSMDEYRRKFMYDTFGNPNRVEEKTSYVSPADSQQNYAESTSNNFYNSQPSIPEKPAVQTPTYVSQSEPTYNFEGSNISLASNQNDFNASSNTESSSNSADIFDSLASLYGGSNETESAPAFPGMIGSSIDDIKTETSSSVDSSFGSNFDNEDDANAENNAVYGLNIDNKISDILNAKEDEEDDTDSSVSVNDNFNSSLDNEFSKPKELTDFSFLREKEDDFIPSIEENLVKEDVQNFGTPSVSSPKFSEPLYSNNSVDSTNDGLIITSSNPIENQKVTVQAKQPQPAKTFSGYNLGMNGIRYNPPPLSLLTPGKPDTGDYSEEQQRKSAMLEESLKAFNVPAKVVNIIRGPKITRYELSVPLGVPVKKIPMYELDIKRALAAKTINIQAPIPGSSYVGIELENDTFTSVSERELLESEAFQNCKDPLPIAVGKDISGEIVVKSLAKMVHLLIAGSTGSGKSVFIHSIVMSLIYKHSPEDLRLIMIDPKKVEFNRYNGLPHLLTPEVVMGSDKAINALKWCVKEMDRRYDLMSKSGYNNIEPYNKSELVKAGQFERFPYIVIIVDELAEIMMANKKEVEACIQRITQLARACGMHLILATQRPSVDIISGVIKNNVPSRIAFSLSSGIDSKTILNTVGAEKLLGQGDMLFSPNGTASMPRLQAAYCSDEEIKAVIDYDKQNNSANYDDSVSSVINAEAQAEGEYAGQVGDAPAPRELDSYFKVAVKLVMQNGGASTSYLQRRLSIGYSRAAKIMDQMEDRGYIAPATGSKVRKVLLTPDQFKEEFNEDFNDNIDF